MNAERTLQGIPDLLRSAGFDFETTAARVSGSGCELSLSRNGDRERLQLALSTHHLDMPWRVEARWTTNISTPPERESRIEHEVVPAHSEDENARDIARWLVDVMRRAGTV